MSPSLRPTLSAWSAVAAIALLPACSGAEAGARGAVAAFEAFQDALFAGDLAAVRALVTTASRPAMARLPLDRLAGRQPLEVVGTRREDPFVVLALRDPQAPARLRTYVVAREGGRWLVDLLETVAYEHEQVPANGGAPRFEPRSLSPAELARIRADYPDEFR